VIDVLVFLYLLDSKETSKMILGSCFFEMVLDLWKIYKTSNFEWRADGRFPFVCIKHQLAYEQTTALYDQQATKYLYIALLPCYFAYVVYSILYEKYKGWYSFFLHSSVGFIYIFGTRLALDLTDQGSST